MLLLGSSSNPWDYFAFRLFMILPKSKFQLFNFWRNISFNFSTSFFSDIDRLPEFRFLKVHLKVCIHVWIYASMKVFMYVCMYVCMNECMYARMYYFSNGITPKWQKSEKFPIWLNFWENCFVNSSEFVSSFFDWPLVLKKFQNSHQ